jgi:hypothetical protein
VPLRRHRGGIGRRSGQAAAGSPPRPVAARRWSIRPPISAPDGLFRGGADRGSLWCQSWPWLRSRPGETAVVDICIARPESGVLVAAWALRQDIEDHVVSAMIEAREP